VKSRTAHSSQGTIVERIAEIWARDRSDTLRSLFDLRFELFFLPYQPEGFFSIISKVWRHLTESYSYPVVNVPPVDANNAVTVLLISRDSPAQYARLCGNIKRLLEDGGKESGCTVNVTQSEIKTIFPSKARKARVFLSAAFAVTRVFAKICLIDPRLAMIICGRMLEKIEVVMQYFHASYYLDNLCEYRLVVSTNENWFPDNAVLRAAKKAGVATALYPHGTIANANLPFVTDFQHFWNDAMMSHFCDDSSIALISGFVESYGAFANNPKSSEPTYDVLITSQLHAWRQGTGVDVRKFKEILEVWAKYLEIDSHLRVAIKLHPWDCEEDRQHIEKLFEGKNAIIFDGSVDLETLVRKSKLHSTVSSGSILTCSKAGIPTLAYTHTDALSNNLGLDLDVFETTDELAKLLATKQYSQSKPDWVEDKFMLRQAASFIKLLSTT
jgi:hypothetical protein